ncbi:MAG: inositol monophosphatase [Cellvibrionales bacterium]|nr:inositol monophosphatase [Cellvibrionales bacterium]
MEPMVNIALRAARKAGDLVIRATKRIDLVNIDEKGRNDFVTDIDYAAENEIIYHLKKAFPEHTIISEEAGLLKGAEEDYQWIIDPLDGTTNFIHGIPHFAISIACKYKGKIEHAVILDPMRQEEFIASRGRGAFLNGNRIRVSNRLSLSGSIIATGIPFNEPSIQNMNQYLKCLHELAESSSGIRRLGAASLDLAYLAAGRFDAFWEMNLKPWDIAAGILLIKEAGGLVSDFSGKDNYLSNGNIVCSTPKLFKPTLQIVQKHLGFLES